MFGRFQARNGVGWAPLERATMDVDPIRLVIRRAVKQGAATADPPGDEAALRSRARHAARAFTRANADLLGIPPDDVDTLATDVLALPEGSTLRAVGPWMAHLTGRRAMRGYEGFDALASVYDVAVVVGDDGEARFVVNQSRIHPRLSMDTRPDLAPEDPRVVRDVTGRELFFLARRVGDEPAHGAEVLSRVSVGRVEPDDVRRVTLHVHVSVGPLAAYVMYHLAYVVDVERGGHRFRFVVDADSGDLLEDAVAPLVERAP